MLKMIKNLADCSEYLNSIKFKMSDLMNALDKD